MFERAEDAEDVAALLMEGPAALDGLEEDAPGIGWEDMEVPWDLVMEGPMQE
jgi:hypothetical protein